MPQLNRVLYRTIFGSRLYGTELPESDYDYKTIYLPDMAELLIGTQFKNMAVQTNADALVARNLLPTLVFGAQEETIPFSCLLRDFYECQSYALEIVHAVVLHGYTYADSLTDQDDRNLFLKFRVVIEELVLKWKNKDTTVMAGYAKAQANKYSIKGDRLNAVRAVQEFLRDQFNAAANYKLGAWLQEGTPELKRLQDICAMYPAWVRIGEYDITKKDLVMRPCLYVLDKVLPYTNTVTHAYDTVDASARTYGVRADAASKAEGKDWKAISHAIRIAQEGISYLQTGTFKFPHEEGEQWTQFLRNVRLGFFPLEQAVKIMETKMAELAEAERLSTWPSKLEPERAEQFKEWMKKTTLDLYKYRR